MHDLKFKAVVMAALLVGLTAQPQRAWSDPGHAHSHGAAFSAGEPGDPSKPARVVNVAMGETADGKMLFAPSTVRVTRGEQVRFVLINAGQVEHEFVLASTADNLKHAAAMQKSPDMKHDDPNGRMLQPREKTELVWRFTKTGTFEFACLIPGHREAGMTGNVTVR